MPPFFDLDRYLADVRRRIDETLGERLPPVEAKDPLTLRAAMRKALLMGGKRLRPCLTVAACQAVGGSIDDALTPACAVEMIHSYSLVHDDLPAMDNDDLRRGQPTCHKEFGESTAILVGDALLTQAFYLLAQEGLRRRDNPMAVVQATAELSRAAGALGMVGGQALDMALKETEPSFEILELCHSAKTAALFSASTAIGALVGGGSAEQVDKLRSYGFDLGLSFQHADDIRDSEYTGFREQSLKRCQELSHRAQAAAETFGERGAPLAALAELVFRRAREVKNENEVSRQN